jgi:hypothetical protein
MMVGVLKRVIGIWMAGLPLEPWLGVMYPYPRMPAMIERDMMVVCRSEWTCGSGQHTCEERSRPATVHVPWVASDGADNANDQPGRI